MVFFGEYYYKVDRQGRTTLPPGLRQKVGRTVILFYLPDDRFISGYPTKGAKQLFDEAADIGLTIGDIFERPLDSRGRITIPAKLREYAEIETVVVIATGDDYFELWGEKHWELEKIEVC